MGDKKPRPPTPQPHCSRDRPPAPAEADAAPASPGRDIRFFSVEPPTCRDWLFIVLIRVLYACDMDTLEGWDGGVLRVCYRLPGLRELTMGWLEPAPPEPVSPRYAYAESPSPPATPQSSPPPTPRALSPASSTSSASSAPPLGSMRATAHTMHASSALLVRGSLATLWLYMCNQPMPLHLTDSRGRVVGHARLPLGLLLSGGEFETFRRFGQKGDGFVVGAVVRLWAGQEGPPPRGRGRAHAHGGGRRPTLTLRVSLRRISSAEWLRRGDTAFVKETRVDARAPARGTRSGGCQRGPCRLPCSYFFCTFKTLRMARDHLAKPTHAPKEQPGAPPQHLRQDAAPKPGPSGLQSNKQTQQNTKAGPSATRPVKNGSREVKIKSEGAEIGTDSDPPAKLPTDRCIRCERKCHCAHAGKSARAEALQSSEEDEPRAAAGPAASRPGTSSHFDREARKRGRLPAANTRASPQNTVVAPSFSTTNSTDSSVEKWPGLRNKCHPIQKRGRFRGGKKTGN